MVTVPVLSSTMVSIRRVDSRTSGPLIRMPSWAPRPVPTISAVGVARPSAHGQAMISTATAAVNARGRVGLAAAVSQKPSVADGEDDHDRHEDRRRPGRRAAAPRPCRSARPRPAGDLGERGVGADAGGPHDEPAADVDASRR